MASLKQSIIDYLVLPVLTTSIVAIAIWVWGTENRVNAMEINQKHLAPMEQYVILSTKLDSQKETLQEIKDEVAKVVEKLNKHMEK